jgi:hypothetical protein
MQIGGLLFFYYQPVAPVNTSARKTATMNFRNWIDTQHTTPIVET